jgi:hypothetical protein
MPLPIPIYAQRREGLEIGLRLGTVVLGHGAVLNGHNIEKEMGAFILYLLYLEATLATASELVVKGVGIEEALEYPGFPEIECDMTDNEVRMRRSCIERAYHEVSQH